MTSYDKSDSRSTLASAKATDLGATEFADCQIARFYETKPQEEGPEGKHWYARGNNFIIAYSDMNPGGTISRKGQIDEYCALISRPDTPAQFKAGDMTGSTEGHSLTFMQPGDSSITFPKGGRVVRLFSPLSRDLAGKCSNQLAFVTPSPNVAPFKAWPAPPDATRFAPTAST